MTVYNLTHRDLNWLGRGMLLILDYNIVVRLSSPRVCVYVRVAHRGNSWPEFLPGPPTNDQETAQLKADIHGQLGAIVEALPIKVNWSNVEL